MNIIIKVFIANPAHTIKISTIFIFWDGHIKILINNVREQINFNIVCLQYCHGKTIIMTTHFIIYDEIWLNMWNEMEINSHLTLNGNECATQKHAFIPVFFSIFFFTLSSKCDKHVIIQLSFFLFILSFFSAAASMLMSLSRTLISVMIHSCSLYWVAHLIDSAKIMRIPRGYLLTSVMMCT